ncbi:hypothetical protein SAMN05216390_104195 [Lachnospiraceae bacterium KH1T2]|nr:hypothetical protein SAMN05216390_104195 [Lachnospiraceae bacterium KH1T2]
MNAEKFYENLLTKFKVNDAFEAWKNYREKLTEYIIAHSEGCRSIAVLGAGSSNDIDLARLYNNFEEVVLFDIDMASMKEALEKYGLTDAVGIRCVEEDFLGLDKEDYVNLIGTDDPAEELEKMYKKVHDYKFDLGGRNFDVCVAVGLHSQLNAMPDYLVKALDMAEGEKLSRRIISENEYITKKMNDAIFEAAAWKVFIGAELLEERGGASNQVQGALQASQDIVERNSRGEIRIEKVVPMEWPFSPAKKRKYTIGIIDISCIRFKTMF